MGMSNWTRLRFAPFPEREEPPEPHEPLLRINGTLLCNWSQIPEGTDWEMFDLDAEVPERKLVWVADHEGSHVYKDPRRRPANLLAFEAQDVEVPKGDEHGKANSKAVKGAQGVALARRDPNLDAAATLLDEE